MTSPRKTYIIANWKMNFTPGQASLYLQRLSNRVQASRDIQVILAPSTISLQPLSLQINRRQFKLAAQNFYWRDFGAFTGETAISQIRSFVDYAIVGHSERRATEASLLAPGSFPGLRTWQRGLCHCCCCC